METLSSIASLLCRRGKLGLGLLKILAPYHKKTWCYHHFLSFSCVFNTPSQWENYPIPEGRSWGFWTCFRTWHLWDGRLCKWYRQSFLACTMRLSTAQALPDLTDLDSKIPGRRDLILELPTVENDIHAQALSHHVRPVSPGLLWEDSRSPSGMASLLLDQNQKI